VRNFVKLNGSGSRIKHALSIDRAISTTSSNQGMKFRSAASLSKSLMPNSCENILLDSHFIAFDEEREIAAWRQLTADGQHRFSFPSNASEQAQSVTRKWNERASSGAKNEQMKFGP
jgi:hypothetical protein